MLVINSQMLSMCRFLILQFIPIDALGIWDARKMRNRNFMVDTDQIDQSYGSNCLHCNHRHLLLYHFIALFTKSPNNY